jgi:Undecaprenyl-phosphate galactose phosphotransferase WbaP
MALVDKVWESVPGEVKSFDSSGSFMDAAPDSYSSDRSAEGIAGQGDAFESYSAAHGGSLSASSIAKRSIDILGSSTLIVLLLPVLLTLGFIVSRDGGSPIFGHERVGRGGRTFRCLKFRSMVHNADKVLADLLARDPQAREEWNRDFKLKNDIRITPIGRILRRTSLDELPQLWNVLRGDMSLVGPRPIVEKELPRYGADARYYLVVKPGMTGLWQVSGRNNVDYATRVSLDVSYVKEQSVLLDMSILVRTVKVVFEKNGAY